MPDNPKDPPVCKTGETLINGVCVPDITPPPPGGRASGNDDDDKEKDEK